MQVTAVAGVAATGNRPSPGAVEGAAFDHVGPPNPAVVANPNTMLKSALTDLTRSVALRTSYPLEDKSSPAGAVNPALQQLDFYIRSLERNAENHPDREVFDHFFAMEVTWL